MKDTSLIYFILLIAVLSWCGLILLAPLAAHYGYAKEAELIYTMFGRVCHQLDSHSLHIGGEKLGVCERCSAIYFSFLFGVVLYPISRRLSGATLLHRRWLLIASIPMCVDVFLSIAGGYTATLLTRLFTGGIFGFILALIIIPELLPAISSPLLSLRRHHAYKT
ncbi:MAG: DUF2085 domain-containing protein [Bacteroidota bacterium]